MKCNPIVFYSALPIVASVCLGACSSQDNVVGGSDGGNAGTSSAALTFWGDVAPIFNQKCVACHQEGGIAPFRLDNYADAKSHALAALGRVQANTMPPYFLVHDGTCGDFHDENALTAEEKATIAGWANGGQAEGTPASLTLPPRPTLAQAVELKTPLFAPVAQGGATAENDEYRCFLMDPPVTTDAFLTGYEVVPGDATIVHHVLAFTVDPQAAASTADGRTNAQVMQALDDASPDRLGWPCFGAAGDGVAVEGIPVTWAPGQGVVNYPATMGFPVRASSKIVVQVHYNLASPTAAGRSDSTTLRFQFANSVSRQIRFLLPDPFLESLRTVDANGNPAPFSLPPGLADAPFTWKRTGAEVGIRGVPSVDLVGVMPHMHGRGLREQLLIGAPGAPACAAHLENWDFHWQQFYFYKTPIAITPDSEIQLTCEYDTSQDTTPVLPGWGTHNEMCLAILMIALPPS